MKKIIIFLLIAISAMFVSAQTQHLMFMGIPLTGTITQFQQKLAAKGVVYDKASSARADSGIRVFKGSFANSKATIVVYFDVSTKIVHGAKAYFDCYSTQYRDEKYDELKSMLKEKYKYERATTEQEDGLENFHITVTDATGLYVIGYIYLYRREDTYSYNEYTVHIEYDDFSNSNKNYVNKMNDL